jgi:hypothetical protein
VLIKESRIAFCFLEKICIIVEEKFPAMKKYLLLPGVFLIISFFVNAQLLQPIEADDLNTVILRESILPAAPAAAPGTGQRDEILIIVKDVIGNESYSKVVITSGEGASLTAIDPYGKIVPGVYTIIGSSKNEIYSQEIVIN